MYKTDTGIIIIISPPPQHTHTQVENCMTGTELLNYLPLKVYESIFGQVTKLSLFNSV